MLAASILLAPIAKAQSFTDTDGDGLSDSAEINVYHTDPKNPDTDGDGVSDGDEVRNGYSPLWPKLLMRDADTDSDGITDDWEIKLGSNLMSKDSDGDGKDDYQEIMIDGTSPTSWDNTPIEKHIEVEVKTFKLWYYFGDTLLDTILVSTGANGWPTPRGEFKILMKVPVKAYVGPGYYLPGTKWNMNFTIWRGARYYIHGAYWHNLFGKRNVSHGCVNVAYKDMERLYNFTPVGTRVIIK